MTSQHVCGPAGSCTGARREASVVSVRRLDEERPTKRTDAEVSGPVSTGLSVSGRPSIHTKGAPGEGAVDPDTEKCWPKAYEQGELGEGVSQGRASLRRGRRNRSHSRRWKGKRLCRVGSMDSPTCPPLSGSAPAEKPQTPPASAGLCARSSPL